VQPFSFEVFLQWGRNFQNKKLKYRHRKSYKYPSHFIKFSYIFICSKYTQDFFLNWKDISQSRFLTGAHCCTDVHLFHSGLLYSIILLFNDYYSSTVQAMRFCMKTRVSHVTFSLLWSVTCSTHGRNKKCTWNFVWKTPILRDASEVLHIDYSLKFQFILKRFMIQACSNLAFNLYLYMNDYLWYPWKVSLVPQGVPVPQFENRCRTPLS
jgi:hypothetical protein